MPRDGQEDTRMCEAFQEILRKERAVGLEQGREEGMEKGIEKGMESMIEAMRKNGLSEEQIEAVLKTADSMKAS
jgi:predicted transposase YdaD